MNRLKIVGAIALSFGILAIAILVLRDSNGSSAFGVSIDDAEYLKEENSAQAFAQFVEPILIRHLSERFEIDDSAQALEDFFAQIRPQHVSSDPEKSDQAMMSRMADAIEAVMEGNLTPEGAYREFSLEEIVPIAGFLGYLDREPGQLEMLITQARSFASKDRQVRLREAIEVADQTGLRYTYLRRQVNNAICALPKQAADIQDRIESKYKVDYNDYADSSLAPGYGFECQVQINRFIGDVLDENVVVSRPEFDGYQAFISLIVKFPE